MAFDKRKALQNALTYTQQGKWDKAIAEYQAILKADPRDLTVCNNLGDLYARAGKVADGIEQYLKLGELYRADGLSVKAIAVYKKIVKLDPNRIAAYLACADLYQEQGLVGEAKVQLATVADHYAKAGDTAKVVETYQRLGQLDPTNHSLLAKLADLLLAQGMREAAATQYDRAAQAAQAAGQPAESKRLFQKARDLQPASPEANLGLGELQLREGKYAEAVEALTKVTAVDASNPQAWRLLGEAYSGVGQTQEGLAALEQAVALGLPQGEVRRPLAMALVQVDRTQEAAALCQAATEDALSRGEPDEAIAFCQELLSVAPHAVSIHAQLVSLVQALGRDEEVRSASWALAAAHEAGGDTEAAIGVYRQLLERDPSDAGAQARLEVLEGSRTPPLDGEGPAISALEGEPGLLLEMTPEPAPEPEVPVAELSVEEAPAFQVEGFLGLEVPLGAVSDAGEPAEVAESSLPPEESAGGIQDLHVEPETPPVEFLDEGIAGVGALDEVEEATGEVAEQLAEAEVYLKYGLAEKARERLLEVLRQAPDNVVARRKLKAIYLDRHQIAEACTEILAIARAMEARRQHEAALREIQEGLALAPDHAELQDLLTGLSGGRAAPVAAAAASPHVEPIPAEAAGLEVPEAAGAVDAFIPQGAPGADWGLGLPVEEEATAAEAVPVFELPLDRGAPEAESLLAPSAAGGPGDGAAAVQDEELPPELRALLEEPEDQAVLVTEEGGADFDQAMADDLAEAEFYLSQGMVEEARAVHQRMQARSPQHPAVANLDGQLARPRREVSPLRAPQPKAPPPATVPAAPPGPSRTGPPVVAPPQESRAADVDAVPAKLAPAGPTQAADLPPPPGQGLSLQEVVPKFTVRDSRDEAGAKSYINLGAELEEELAAEERAVSPKVGGPLVDGLLKEFQKGVREHLDEKDFETHYNLGIAYKEMELYDEAIQEFRLAGRDPGRALMCVDLLGLCFLAKGQPDQAIRELRAGLEMGGQPREAYYSLRYDLGVAYETQGDPGRALEQFEALQTEDARFRDVRTRVQELRERLQRLRPPAVPPTPVQTGEPPPRTKDKKISFI